MKQELICIVCPKGCHLTAEQTAEGWQITGFGCPRGQQYGIAEMTNPTRVVTSTVRITGGVRPPAPFAGAGSCPDAGCGGNFVPGVLRRCGPARYRRDRRQFCCQPRYVKNPQVGRNASSPFLLF